MRIISGEHRGRSIKTISGPGYRPATDKIRQAIFSMLEARGVLWSDCRIMDLFAGSGALGMEALSRGANAVWFVEKSGKACSNIKENLQFLDINPKRYNLLCKDVFSLLRNTARIQPFDVVFIDPPYGRGFVLPALNNLLHNNWIHESSYVVSEVEAELEFEPNQLSGLQEDINRLYGQTRIYLWIVKDKK